MRNLFIYIYGHGHWACPSVAMRPILDFRLMSNIRKKRKKKYVVKKCIAVFTVSVPFTAIKRISFQKHHQTCSFVQIVYCITLLVYYGKHTNLYLNGRCKSTTEINHVNILIRELFSILNNMLFIYLFTYLKVLHKWWKTLSGTICPKIKNHIKIVLIFNMCFFIEYHNNG